MRSPRFALSLCLVAAYGWGAAVHAEDLTPASVWMTDFAKAQAEAKRLHRPMVVHFHASYCRPCRYMEKQVLHTPQVLKQLDAGFIAVKVDMEHATNAKVVKTYNVVSMPTDLVLSHDGTVLHRSVGYDEKTNNDRQKYVTALNGVDAKYAAEGKRIARSTANVASASETSKAVETPAAAPPRAVAANTQGQGTVNKLVPDPVEPRLIGETNTAPAKTEAPAKPVIDVDPVLQLALDGYCPVTLRTTRTWKKGNQDYALVHDGQKFLFEAAAKRDEFKANPGRYAPKLLGCDPVVLAENNLAIRGSTKFGAFYEGELFLFETADNRAKFRKEPTRFIRLKHALKPEDVKEAKDVKDVRKLAVTVAK